MPSSVEIEMAMEKAQRCPLYYGMSRDRCVLQVTGNARRGHCNANMTPQNMSERPQMILLRPIVDTDNYLS